MVGVRRGVRKGWYSNLLLSWSEEGEYGTLDGEFASASRCVDAGGGLNTPSAPCEGEEAGTTARPALHTLVYYKSNIMWLPNGQIFAGSSIFTPGRSQDNCSEESEVQDSLWQEFTPTRWFDESPNLHALDHSANLALIIWKL